MKKFPQLPNIPCQKMGFFETQVVPFSHRQVWHSFRFCVSNSFGVKPVVIFRWPTRCHQKVLSSRFLQATWIQDWLFLVIIEFTEFEGDKRHSHFGWSQIQVPKYHVFFSQHRRLFTFAWHLWSCTAHHDFWEGYVTGGRLTSHKMRLFHDVQGKLVGKPQSIHKSPIISLWTPQVLTRQETVVWN